MFGGASILCLVCLLCFLSPHVTSQYRTTYTYNFRRRQAGTNVRGNAVYSTYSRRNNSWLPHMNPMAFSYTGKNSWNHARRRQDIYDGSDYDWEGFPVEDTPTWPPDYNAWPQTASPTQVPSQVVPQYPQQVPTKGPFQAPYQVPSVMPTQMTVPLGSQSMPQARIPISTSQAQIWRPRVKPQNDMKLPVKLEAHNASRVCSPGPPLGVNPLFRNCLVIGDSISLGYLTTVKGQLKGLCQVQHAPFAKGSGAVDSRYGLHCLSMMLHTTALERTNYDAIVFNFGMHDINYSKMFPEEFVPLEEYGQNLVKIKELLLESGAQVAFALTTPVPIAGRRNERVMAYNKEARRIMEEGKKVEIVDLHSAVIHVCGEPPYKTCGIMRRPGDVGKTNLSHDGLNLAHVPYWWVNNPSLGEFCFAMMGRADIEGSKSNVAMNAWLPQASYPCGNFSDTSSLKLLKTKGSIGHAFTHFNPKGNRLLGIKISAALRSLLSKAKPRGRFSPPRAPELSAREGLASSYLHDGTSFCPDMVTRCPPRTTCCENLLSLTGYGCCMHQEAMSCPDNWHCCPRGSHCSPDCNFRSCKCLSPSLHPAAVSKSHQEAQESISNSESHSTSVKPVKGGKEKKIESKTEKKQKEIHKTSKETNTMRSRKKGNGKTKHKLNLKDEKHKKHKQSRKKKERKKTKKLRSKAKDKGSKSKNLKKLKKAKAIQKMNKNVVKAHKNHQKTNFHPKPKQHWVTIFNEGLSAANKHKPNIKFSHTWGKQKHQKLSYKSNGNENSNLDKNASMADELKHLIVNHRKEKLRRRLKLRLGGHVKHMHGNHRKGFTGRRKQTKGKKQKEERIHSSNTLNILQKHDSKSIVEEHRKPNKYNVEEHRTPTKTEDNPSRLTENENHVAVNVFSNLRQTLQEKSLSKENVSSNLDSSKLKANIIEHMANTTTENKTNELGTNKSDSVSKSGETTDSVNDPQITSFNEKMPLNISNNEPEVVGTNLEKVSDTSNNAPTDNELSNSSTFNSSSASGVTSIDKEGELGSSEEVGVLNVVHTTDGSLQSGEGESSTNSLTLVKPSSSEIGERTTGQDQKRLTSKGNVQNGRNQNDKALPSILARNVSNADNDTAMLVTGMRSQARTYHAASGSGLEADESFTGPASGFEVQTTLSGDNEDSFIDEHIKVFLGGEETSGSTKDLEESEISNEFPTSGDWSSESLTSEDDDFHKTSTWTSAYAGSSDAMRESGSSFESFSAESGNDLHFGGEGDDDEDTNLEERKFYSSGRDDIHQPELFPSRGTTSLNHVQKPEFVKADGGQSFQLQNGDFDSSSSTDISQMRDNVWDDTKESYSGFGSGSFESSTDEWGSGGDGSSLIRLSTQTKPISLRNNTTADNSNTANLEYQNSGDFVEDHGKNKVVSGEDMNLEKRNHILGSLTDGEKRSFDETELRVKSLRHKHTENSINAENNVDLMSWKEKELAQLLYWLSVATDVEKKQLKQITAYKDVWRLRPKPTSGYSRLQGMLLDKILPDLSRKERKKFDERNEEDK